MCAKKELINHFIAECRKLAQKECKQKHDNIARILHVELWYKFGLVGDVKWYNHKSESVVENDKVKLLWHFHIQTDHSIQHIGPGIALFYKIERKCHFIDIDIPGDKRVEQHKNKKVGKYSDLR